MGLVTLKRDCVCGGEELSGLIRYLLVWSGSFGRVSLKRRERERERGDEKDIAFMLITNFPSTTPGSRYFALELQVTTN